MKTSPALDLGLDRTRIKNADDARRQHATIDAILERMFHPRAAQRQEVQILADEVGMGKTYVALGAAFSILEQLRAGKAPDDLTGTFQKVLVIAPPNASLVKKWNREVQEFVRRCVRPAHRDEAGKWFQPIIAERLDEVVVALRKPGPVPQVVITKMTAFGTDKFQHYDVKRRFLLGALFRHWGNAFPVDARERMLRGAPEDWPADPYHLTVSAKEEAEWLPFKEGEAVEVLQGLDRPGPDGKPSDVELLRSVCREIGEPYARNRDVRFEEVSAALNQLYRDVTLATLRRALPLVIVDEAHNWKNGPDGGSNGYEYFEKYVAPLTRRLLLLTATPFQLRPQEMLTLIRIGEACQLAPERGGSKERRKQLEKRRLALETVVERAAESSKRLARAWTALREVGPHTLEEIWGSKPLAAARSAIEALRGPGAAPTRELRELGRAAVRDVHARHRAFFEAALVHFANQRDLTRELAPIVIRHRRKTDHRVFKVGHEYQSPTIEVACRPDRNVLHHAHGLDIRGDAELPQYLLMRCVTESKKKGRSALGSALTGCWSTLLDSREGSTIRERLAGSGRGARYLELLEELVDRKRDHTHPKLRLVADEVITRWHAGEKTLVFCFRVNTAERLRDIIDEGVRKELVARRRQCLGGEDQLTSLRQRLTSRDRELIPILLDRVLWSLYVTPPTRIGPAPWTARDLELQDGDLAELARAAICFGIPVDDERADRVFLERAVQHVVAIRLLRTARPGPGWRAVLTQMAEPAWIARPYGLALGGDGDGGAEDGAVDERGVHHVYPVRVDAPPYDAVSALAERLRARRDRARQVSLLDVSASGPSLWFGGGPDKAARAPAPTVKLIHEHVNALTFDRGESDWAGRLLVMQALRRIVLRESVLVRVLPGKAERARSDQGWGELLVEKMHAPFQDQPESLAERIAVYLEDLRGATGTFTNEVESRGALLAASRLRDQKFVALVKGGDQATRERVFAGFNTPLLPEILICTSVGAEGIDLHRHCRHVVHYDLAWNPAVMEQRTGRVDRIGSKTFRDRDKPGGEGTYLEVGVPYLAGTYDERMYEELRLRAQQFEVLTGGDVAADSIDGADEADGAEGKAAGIDLVPLPASMLDDLRVKLHVWEAKTSA